MRLIKENGLNILKADENKLLKVIGDDYKPQIKDEEGNIIEEEYIPYTTDTVYLGKSFDTLEKAKNIYEEIFCPYRAWSMVFLIAYALVF